MYMMTILLKRFIDWPRGLGYYVNCSIVNWTFLFILNYFNDYLISTADETFRKNG